MTEEFRIELGLGIGQVETAIAKMDELVAQLGESGGSAGEGDLAAALSRDIGLLTEYRDRALEVAAAQSKIGASGAANADVYAPLVKAADAALKSVETLDRSINRSATGTPSTAALDKYRAGVQGITSAYGELLAIQERVGAGAAAPVSTGLKDRVGNDILVGDQVKVTAIDRNRGATQQLLQEPATVVGGGRNRVQIDSPATTGIDRVGNEYLQVVKAVDDRMIVASTTIDGMNAGQRAVAESSQAVSVANDKLAVAENETIGALRNAGRALNGLAAKAADTGTLDAFKTIHNARFGVEEPGNVADALGGDASVNQITRASRAVVAKSQAALEAAGVQADELLTVFRQNRGAGSGRGIAETPQEVVSVSTKPLSNAVFPDQEQFTVLSKDVLTYGEALQRGTFAEGELQVQYGSLRDVNGNLIASGSQLAAAQTEAAAKVTLSTAEVAAIADRNVSPGIRAQGYTQSLREGTGQFEGQGIAQVGIQKPLQIVQSDIYPQGQLQDGEHRLAAAQQLGLPEVPVEIRNANGDLISAVEFRANAERAAAESTARTEKFLSEAAEEQKATISQGASAIRDRLDRISTLIEAPPSTEQNFALEPTPGAPAVVAPKPTGVQDGLTFAENQDLALQAPTTAPKNAAEARAARQKAILDGLDEDRAAVARQVAADQQAAADALAAATARHEDFAARREFGGDVFGEEIASGLEQQAATVKEEVAVEEENLLNQQQVAAAIRAARESAKAASKEIAAITESDLREYDLVGLAEPPLTKQLRTIQSGAQKGRDVAYNVSDLGGEYDFLQSVTPNRLEQYRRAGFITPTETDRLGNVTRPGARPDEFDTRIDALGLATQGRTPLEELLRRWDDVIEGRAASRVNIENGGRKLDESLVKQGFADTGLAPNQITPELVAQARSPYGPEEAARRLFEQTGGVPLAADRDGAAAALAQTRLNEELAQVRSERQARDDAVARQRQVAASVSPEVATIEALQQPELVPAPPRPAAPVEKTLEAATGAEENLVKSINRKIEALDLQTQATTEARLAEGRLAKAADAAATAKRDQADAILKEVFPTAGAGGEDASPAAIARRIALLEAQLNAKAIDAERTAGLGNKPPPASPVSAARDVGYLGEGGALDKIQKAADLEEAKAASGTGTGSYAEAAAKLRTQYERSSANTAEAILAQSKAAGEDNNYAEQKARATRLQAEVNAKVQEVLSGNDSYIKTLAEAKILHQQEAAAVQKILAASSEYATALAEDANARRVTAAAAKSQKLQGAGLENTPIAQIALDQGASIEEAKAAALRGLNIQEGNNAALEQTQKAERDLAAIKQRQVVADERIAAGLQTQTELQVETQRLTNQFNLAQKKLVAEQERAAFNLAKAQGAGTDVVGTRFQQLQSSIASRPGSFRSPTEFLDLGQFLQSRFLTTVGFGVSGIATYAAFAGIQNMLKSGQELEKVLEQIKAEFGSLGDAGDFTRFRAGIIDISQKTGEAAASVAQLALQFKGAFGATLNDGQILQQVQSAVELARVTGISLQDIQNGLTGTAVSFGTDIEHVGDVLLTLQDRTGVAATEMIKGLSAVAVTAQNIGLSIEQTGAIIAVSAKYTGQSADTVGEGLNRIFPNLQAKAGQVVELFQQADPSKLGQVTSAFSTGNLGGVLDALGTDYNKLSKSQQEYLQQLVGGSRNAKVLTDVLEHYAEVQQDANDAQNSGGRLAQSYANLQQTLAQQLAKVVTGLRDIGAELLSAGVSSALQDIAKALGAVIATFADAVKIVADFNSALHGIPATLALILVAMKAIGTLGGTEGLLSGLTAVPLLGGGRTPAAKAAPEFAGDLTTGVAVAAPATRGSDLFGVGGRIRTLGDGVQKSAQEAGGKIGSAGTFLGKALDGFGALWEVAGPILAIAAAIQFVTAILNGLTDNKVLKAQATLFENLGGQDQTTGQPGQPPKSAEQTAADTYNTLYQQQRTISANPFTDVTRATRLLAGKAGKDASQVQADVVQQATSQNFAKVLQQFLSQQDLGAVLGEAASQTGANPAGSGFVTPDDLKKIAEKGTTDDKKWNTIVQAFTDAAQLRAKRGQDSKALGQAYQKLSAGPAGLQLKEKFAQGLQDLPNLQIQQQTGQISNSDFLGQVTDLVDSTTLILDQAIKNNAAPDYINTLKQALDSARQARDQVYQEVQKNLQASYQNATAIASGGSQQAAQLAQLRGDIAALSLPFSLADAATDASSAQVAQDLIKVQQQQIQYEATHAKNLADTNKILFAPQQINPKAIQALNANALETLPPGFENELKRTAQRVAPDRTFDQFVSDLATATGGIIKAIRARILQLANILAHLAPGSNDAKDVQDQINSLRRLITSGLLVTQTTTTGAGGIVADTSQQVQDAKDALRKAQVGQDPVAAAQEAQKEAQRNANQDVSNLRAARAALASASKSGNKDAIQQAQAAIQNAKDKLATDSAAILTADQQFNDTQDAILQAKAHLAQAEAFGDPVKEAAAALQAASAELQVAERKGDKAGILNAQANYDSALLQASQAQQSIAQALVAVETAQADGNPFLAAQAALQAANVQAANAHGRAEQLNALAAQISAQHQLRDAMNAIADAQESVVLAMLNAAGDVVGAANEQVKKDKSDLARYISQHPGATAANDPQVSNLTAKIITDQAAARDALLNKQEQDIQFALDTNKISTGQAIVRLQNLLSTANITEAERQNIERQIFQLKQQITKDLQFDLPSLTGDLGLAGLLYQSRRLGETGAAGQGYQDNRQINININGTNMTQKQLVDAVTTAVNQPPRQGTFNRSY